MGDLRVEGERGRWPSRAKLRRVLAVLAFNALLIAIGVVVLELIFGGWFQPNRLNRLNLLRDLERTFETGHLYESDEPALYRRDAYGLRGAYSDLASIDILTLGGSTTDQRYVGEGATWQDVLAEELSKNGRTVSVVNGGIDGQSVYGHIRNFDWWFPLLPELEVRFFLFYIGVNDFFIGGRSGFDQLDPPPSLARLLRERSALYRLQQTVTGMWDAFFVARAWHRGVDFEEVVWTPEPLEQDYAGILAERLPAYRERLAALLDKTTHFGGEPICVTQSTRHYKTEGGTLLGVEDSQKYEGVRINGVDRFYLMSLLNQATVQVCEEKGAVVIDLASELEWRDEDFYDFFHNTPTGARKIGRYLHRRLEHLFQ